MTPDFSTAEASTWPVVLTLEHVAQIYGRTAHALRHACKPSSKSPFTPRPYRKHPFLWRRSDVERDVFGSASMAAQPRRTRTRAA